MGEEVGFGDGAMLEDTDDELLPVDPSPAKRWRMAFSKHNRILKRGFLYHLLMFNRVFVCKLQSHAIMDSPRPRAECCSRLPCVFARKSGILPVPGYLLMVNMTCSF